MGFFDNKEENAEQPAAGEYLRPGWLYVFFMKDGRKVLAELISIEEVNGPGMLGVLSRKTVGYKVYRKFKEKILNEQKVAVDRSVACKSYIKDDEVSEILSAHHYPPGSMAIQMKFRRPRPEPQYEEPTGEYP